MCYGTNCQPWWRVVPCPRCGVEQEYGFLRDFRCMGFNRARCPHGHAFLIKLLVSGGDAVYVMAGVEQHNLGETNEFVYVRK